MKAILMMFDSLNKRMLEPYGCDWTHTPNFRRLAEHGIQFENCYAGSLPCMPARRELHTGRYNFLHRSWGPMEPFDDSMPEILKNNGIYTHLISDHYHYWEDGGATYHTRYKSWEIVRGQEGDPWKANVKDPEIPRCALSRESEGWRQDWVNRRYIDREEKFPLVKSVELGEEFLRENHDCDNWFLHLECFDPHEPFYSPEYYKQKYPHDYEGDHFDWPPYRQIGEQDSPQAKEHIRCQYASLLSMCDTYLGKILDVMDEYNMWEDTLLIVNTDHGYMLGEHEWWGKNVCPLYTQIANTPLFIWDPRLKIQGETRNSLVQTIDLVPTLYNYFGIPVPGDVMGRDLSPVLEKDEAIRTEALYGIHGATINCTDGRYIYMCAPDKNIPDAYNYTLMCTHLRQFFTVDELHTAELAGPFAFTKGCKVLKIKKGKPKFQSIPINFGDMLFDLQSDPDMNEPVKNNEVELRMRKIIARVLRENDAPEELYEKYGLTDLL